MSENEVPLSGPVSPDAPVPTGGTTKAAWGPIAGVVYSLAVAFVGGSVAASLILGLVWGAFGMNETSFITWVTTPFGALLYSLLSAVITVGLIALYIARSHSNWRSIGIIPPRWKHVRTAVVAVLIYFAIYVVVISVVKALIPALNLEQEQDLGITTPHGMVEMILVFVTLVVLPPIVEETVFRGFMFSGLRTRLPFVVSAILTSMLFALGHLQLGNGTGAPLLWVAAIDTFVLSMVMCYVRERTGSIVPTMIMHLLKNLLAFSFLYIFVG